MSVKPELAQIAQNHWNAKPHPQAPSLTIGQYPQAVRLATKARFGGHATPPEAAAFWREFQQTGMDPAEFEHILDHAAPVSFAHHGRPPSMTELAKFSASKATPSQIREFYQQLPDAHYPSVSSGQMLAALKSAEPWFEMHLGRKPTKKEAEYLVHSKQNPAEYAQQLAAQMNPGATSGGAPSTG